METRKDRRVVIAFYRAGPGVPMPMAETQLITNRRLEPPESQRNPDEIPNRHCTVVYLSIALQRLGSGSALVDAAKSVDEWH